MRTLAAYSGEGHVGETLAVQAAQVDLIGMEIRRAEPLAGDAAAGDRLEVSGRRIDLDGFLLDELIAQFGLPKMADGFLAGEENGLIELAAEQRRRGARALRTRRGSGRVSASRILATSKSG